MSRIGKQPIKLPSGVTITVNDTSLEVTGPKGKLVVPRLNNMNFKVEGDTVTVDRTDEDRVTRAHHGLQRSLLNNAVVGVSKGFSKKLEIVGIGFRLSGGGRQIEMALGYSHPVKYSAPEGIDLKVEKMELTVSGIDKQLVGQVAAEIRSLRKPEPYKGKGIRYSDEIIIKKAGKAGKKTA